MTTFVVLEAGFGLGHRFLATWRGWVDAEKRSASAPHERLVFIAVEPHPPMLDELTAAHRTAPDRESVDALLAAWPPLTPNLHRLSFAGGRVQLLLLVSELVPGLSELVANVDEFVLNANGGDALRCDERLCKALARLAAPEASVTILNAAPQWQQALRSSGFDVARAVAVAAVVVATNHPAVEPPTLRAVYAPKFIPRRAPARTSRSAPSPTRRALIVGGGLAGCAAAWALAEHGWHSTVLERHHELACEGSGNAAGLFHGIVNAQDGLHARFNRAAALEAHRAVQIAIAEHHVSGGVQGLLRLEGELSCAGMQAILTRLGLPTSYLQAVDATAASALAGLALAQPAWFYPGGGWVHPGGLARSYLERAGPLAALRLGVNVQTLRRTATGWCACDAAGAVLAEADVVVLANAGDALRLLGNFDAGSDGAAAPMEPVRGQISWLPAAGLAWPLPRIPVAGAGYLLPEVDGQAIFGATAQRGDADASVRRADHTLNLEQLERLIGTHLNLDAASLQGRTAWRWVTGDRLPIIGAVPDVTGYSGFSGTDAVRAGCGDQRGDQRRDQHRIQRLDQPRFVPRQAGLFVFAGLGSRGITWSALGGQILAASVSGAPMPVEASLVDAVDPARFVARRYRRAGAG